MRRSPNILEASRCGWLLTLALVIAAAAAMVAPRPAAAGEFTDQRLPGRRRQLRQRRLRKLRDPRDALAAGLQPVGPGLRGLVTANVVTGSRVAHGAQSAFVLNAPPGTAFSRLRWSGHAQRRDCRYALQMYAVRPDGSDATIKNVRAEPATAPTPKRRRRRAGHGLVHMTSAEPRRSCSASSASAPLRPVLLRPRAQLHADLHRGSDGRRYLRSHR